MDRRRAYPRTQGRRAPPPQEPTPEPGTVNYMRVMIFTLAATVLGLSVFTIFKLRRRPSALKEKETMLEKERLTKSDLSESKPTNVVIAPPKTSIPVNKEKLKWWVDIANEQIAIRDFNGAVFYAMKAIDEMSNDPEYELSLNMAEMNYVLASAIQDQDAREKHIQTCLKILNKYAETKSDRFYLLQGKIHKAVADSLLRNENFAQAESHLKTSFESFKHGGSPDDKRINANLAVTLYSLASVQEKLNKLAEADQSALDSYDYSILASSFQLATMIYKFRVNVLTKMDKIEEAIEFLRTQIMSPPEGSHPTFISNLHYTLGATYFGDERVEEAIESLKDCLKLFEGHGAAVTLLTSCYFELGREDEGRNAANKILTMEDLHLSASRYLNSSFLSFNSEESDGPNVFCIELTKTKKKDIPLLQPGNFLECDIKRFYQDGDIVTDDQDADILVHTVTGDEEKDTITFSTNLKTPYDKSYWYEIYVKIYEDDSKENILGRHYQLITTTSFTMSQYERIRARKLKEEKQKMLEESQKESEIEEITAKEESSVEESAPQEESKIEEIIAEEESSVEESAPQEESKIEEIVAEEDSTVEEPVVEEESNVEEPIAEEESKVEEPVVEEESKVEEPTPQEETKIEEEIIAEEESKVEEPKIEEETKVEEPVADEESHVEEPIAEEESKVEEPAIEEESKVEDPITEEEPRVEEAIAEEESKVEEPAIEEESTVEDPAIEEESKDEEPIAEDEVDENSSDE